MQLEFFNGSAHTVHLPAFRTSRIPYVQYPNILKNAAKGDLKKVNTGVQVSAAKNTTYCTTYNAHLLFDFAFIELEKNVACVKV